MSLNYSFKNSRKIINKYKQYDNEMGQGIVDS